MRRRDTHERLPDRPGSRVNIADRSFWLQAADSVAIKVMERLGVALLLIICGFMLTTGKSMVSGVWDTKIQELMQPRLDAADRRADTLDRELEDLKASVHDIRCSERAFFGAQMDLDPRFRRAVELRVAQKRENDSALNGLMHGK